MAKHSLKFLVNNLEVNTDDFNIHVNDFDIPSPVPKMNFVDIEGRSGALDLSEIYGLQYSNIEWDIEMVFKKFDNLEFNRFKALLNGKRVKLIIDDDGYCYYYDARIVIGNAEKDVIFRKCTITVNANPYKLKVLKSHYEVSGANKKIYLKNDVMPVVPTFICSGETTIKFKDLTTQVSKGEHLLANIVLEYGLNELIITSNSKVIIEYQEGAL